MDCHRDRALKSRSVMRWSTLWLAALALVGVVLGPGVGDSAVVRAQQQHPLAATPLVFDGVTVIDVQRGQRLPAQRVVIVGNRIRAVGSIHAVRVPTGARVVEARGKYLIPGLWDMHTHSHHYTNLFYPLFIANGVTGIRDAGSEARLDSLILWRREILAGARVGPPRQLLSGPAIDGEANPDCKRADQHQMTTCYTDSADARHLVDSLKAAGADLIKLYDRLPRDQYFNLAAEARRVGLPFGGHLNVATASEASDSGAALLDHVMTAGGLDTMCLTSTASIERCQSLAERFRRNGTWWVPTLVRASLPTASESLLGRFAHFSADFWSDSVLVRNWLRDPHYTGGDMHTIDHNTLVPNPGSPTDSGGFLSLVHRVGLPILAGTDTWPFSNPPFGIHAELAMYVAEGLTPLEALQSATLNPARFLHGTDSLGTVAPGKLADLVLLDADPLSDITNTTAIRAVVANGRYFDRAALDQLWDESQVLGEKLTNKR